MTDTQGTNTLGTSTQRSGPLRSEVAPPVLHGRFAGIDLDKLVDAGKAISDYLGRKPNSRAATAILNKRTA